MHALINSIAQTRTIEHIGIQFDGASSCERVIGGLIVDKKYSSFSGQKCAVGVPFLLTDVYRIIYSLPLGFFSMIFWS